MSDGHEPISTGTLRPIDVIMRGRAEEPATPLEAALRYAVDRRWAVVPLYGSQLGMCLCAFGEKCSLPAGHPSLPNGVLGASAEPASVNAAWAGRPNANVGLATGSVSKVVALRVTLDKYTTKALAHYANRHGPLPKTLEVMQGETRTYLFAYDGPPLLGRWTFPVTAPEIFEGTSGVNWDFRLLADGDVVALPPSVDPKTGAELTWAAPLNEVQLARLPRWLLRLAEKNQDAAVRQTTLKFNAGEAVAALALQARRLRREGHEVETIESVLLDMNRRRCEPPLDDEVVREIASRAPQKDKDVEDEEEQRYTEHDGRLALIKRDRHGDPMRPEPLSNFTARAVAEIVRDEHSGEDKRELLIEGKLSDGSELPTICVPIEKFANMDWPLIQWGLRANIEPGQAVKSHLRAAIQSLSPDVPLRRIYMHTGWRKIGDSWCYLHAGGAISAEGQIKGVEVQLGGRLAHVRLPDPPARRSDELEEAVRASLRMLDIAPEGPMIGALLLGAAYRAMLNEAAPVTTALWVEGPSGAFKSQIAGLAQAHYGADFHGDFLPANWNSTANAIEKLAFLAKDALLVVDDFAPSGTPNEVHRLHGAAAQIIRNAGNHQERSRLTSETALRQGYVARGFFVSTGEDVARDFSIKARLIVASLQKGTIPADALSEAQALAREGVYATAMSGYARWLAPRLDTLRTTLRERIATNREELRAAAMHARTPQALANIIAAWETFLDYAVEDAGLSPRERDAILARVREAIVTSTKAQMELTSEDDPARKVVQYIRAALESKNAHVAGLDGRRPPTGAWGWVQSERDAGENSADTWQPRGDLIGYLPSNKPGLIYLLPDAAYKAAQAYARQLGETIAITRQRIFKRMREAGLLLDTDEKRQRLGVRVRIQGMDMTVLVMSAHHFGGAPARDIASYSDDGTLTTMEAYMRDDENAPLMTSASGVLLDAIESLEAKSGLALRDELLAIATARGVRREDIDTELKAMLYARRIEPVGEGAYRTARRSEA